MIKDIRYYINLVSSVTKQTLCESETEIWFIQPNEYRPYDREQFWQWYKSKRDMRAMHKDIAVPFTLWTYDPKDPESEAWATNVTVWISLGGFDGETVEVDIDWIENADHNQNGLTYNQMFSVWFACTHNQEIREQLETIVWDTHDKRSTGY